MRLRLPGSRLRAARVEVRGLRVNVSVLTKRNRRLVVRLVTQQAALGRRKQQILYDHRYISNLEACLPRITIMGARALTKEEHERHRASGSR